MVITGRCLAVAALTTALWPAYSGATDGAAAEGSGDPVLVAASIFPLGSIAREVGGDAVRVEVLLPAGASPHGFEPSPAQAERLAGAELLLVVGLGVDPWAGVSAKASGNRRLQVLAFGEAVGPGARPKGAGGDPHVWLDPVQALQYADTLTAVLAVLRPAAADRVRERGARFREELEALDRDYRERLARLEARRFVALHPAFSHPAARYGLEQVSVYDAHMHEPGARAMEAVLRAVREEGVRAVFGEPQMPGGALNWLREQTGVSIGLLDPIGNPAVPGYDGYLAMMRSNLDALARGLGEPPAGTP